MDRGQTESYPSPRPDRARETIAVMWERPVDGSAISRELAIRVPRESLAFRSLASQDSWREVRARL